MSTPAQPEPQARADRLNAAVTLFQALGGGWSAASNQGEHKEAAAAPRE